MSSSSRTSKAPTQLGRPGRTLAIMVLVLIALLSIAFIQDATSIRLGLDLRGGTSVTLQPRVAAGESGKVTNEAIDQAVSIIRQRVDSLGVGESEVTSQGNGADRQIIISVPGDSGRRVVDLVGQTAELRFRQVLVVGAPVPTATGGTSSATPPFGVSAAINDKYAALDCTQKINRQGSGSDVAGEAIVACDRTGDSKYILGPAEVLGRQVSKAAASIDQTTGSGWYVTLTFDGSGTKDFGALTTRVTSLAPPLNAVAIVLDGLVVSAPRINEAITGGSAQITGNFTQGEAEDLTNVLKYGALPLAFDRGEVQQISATLGSDQLRASLLAGLLGLALVILYSLLYYRGLGMVAVGSLLVAAVLMYFFVVLMGKWVGFTLTLAGIAGVIVAIGITADSFIVYFERIRDEVREGRSLRSAVESGWIRARRTIIVADFVSIIAATLLYLFAVGGVRGFAFTLGLTTLIDLFVVFFFTKPLITLLARINFFSSGHRFSGFSTKSLGLVTPTLTSTVKEA